MRDSSPAKCLYCELNGRREIKITMNTNDDLSRYIARHEKKQKVVMYVLATALSRAVEGGARSRRNKNPSHCCYVKRAEVGANGETCQKALRSAWQLSDAMPPPSESGGGGGGSRNSCALPRDQRAPVRRSAHREPGEPIDIRCAGQIT